MVFLILNIITVLVFVLLTYYIDKVLQIDTKSGSALLIPLLMIIIEEILFIVVLLLRGYWMESITTTVMKIIFCFDGIFFVTFSFSLISMAGNTKKFIINLIKFALYASVIVMVYKCFEDVTVGEDYSITVVSSYIFDEEAREFFPWTWLTMYYGIYRFFIPTFCYIFHMQLQEKKNVPLLSYQGVIIGSGILVMWILMLLFLVLDKANPAFSSLYMLSYLFMYVIICGGVKTTAIPSGRGFAARLFRFFICYVIPAAAIAAVVLFLQPAGNFLNFNFIAAFVAISVVAVFFSLKISDAFNSSKKAYTADYGPALERDLAGIDYTGEMDEIIDRMNEIFRRNVESSSMNVYISNSKGMLETAYSSNGLKLEIPINTPMFEELLNINKSVVCLTEVGNTHVISVIEKPLTDFFEKTKSDVMFLLNEGRNVLGMITLGKRINGDHFKEYDYNVFNKLYSYFFVFGYYMRNISNKDIIGIVNREIRMSSQIITSIQENIDVIKDQKVDTGYLMVPARNIGGEFIDLIRLTDTRHLFVVGDLSGKGIAASMNMVILKSIIRTYLSETHDFKELVVKINTFIRDSLRKGTVFAGLFALIDFETDTMYYINCGIPALMLYTQVYNNVIEIQGSGHMLGFVKDLTPFISVKTTKLSRGDIILACTDGLVQSHSLRGEQFGKERIQQCVLDNSTYNAQRMAQFTFDSLLKFMSKEMEDDVSILVLKYETAAKFADDEETNKEVLNADVQAVPDEVIDVEAAVQSAQEEPVVEQPVEEAPAFEMPADIDPEAAAAIAMAQAEMAGMEEEVPVEEPVVEEPVVEDSAFSIPSEESMIEEPAIEIDEKIEEAASPAENTEETPADGAFEIDADDPDLPDLSNLDDMLKMAGL